MSSPASSSALASPSFEFFEDTFGGDRRESEVGGTTGTDPFEDIIRQREREAVQVKLKTRTKNQGAEFSWELMNDSEKQIARLEARLAEIQTEQRQRQRQPQQQQAVSRANQERGSGSGAGQGGGGKKKEAVKKTTGKGSRVKVDELGMVLNMDELDLDENGEIKKGKAARSDAGEVDEVDDGVLYQKRDEVDEEPMLGWDLRAAEKEWAGFLTREQGGDSDGDAGEADDSDDDEEAEEHRVHYVGESSSSSSGSKMLPPGKTSEAEGKARIDRDERDVEEATEEPSPYRPTEIPGVNFDSASFGDDNP